MSLEDEIASEIASGDYICLICHSEISEESEIFSCEKCYRVFDVNCIREWARRSTTGEWNCPHCAHVYPRRFRITYRCWCKKVSHPVKEVGQAPHSCGQTCGAKLKCPHPCTKTCHPGHHVDSCRAMGPPIHCKCGKNVVQRPCVTTPYGGWTCKTVCGERRKCGHVCKRTCHVAGKCGVCKAKVVLECKGCGDTVKRQCNETKRGASCGRSCDAKLDCGLHKCMDRKCGHEGDHSCSLKPKDFDKCPCGRHLVVDLLDGRMRSSCVDNFPVCGSTCGKRLACGHFCQSKCHNEGCPPCTFSERVPCRCGNKKALRVCGQALPQCHSKCGASLSCGRHRCKQECCPIRRPRRYSHIESELALLMSEAHACDRLCNKTLSCGLHQCLEPCHLGPCRPCLVSSSDDWCCACGSTVLRAPIRCGTRLPACQELCRLTQPCGHDATHICHDPSTPCRPCGHARTIKCPCGESATTVRCSEALESADVPCAHYRQLKCGHRSPKPCIEGWKEDVSCSQACSKKLSCGHPCRRECHSGPCGTCALALRAECPCGNLQLHFECGEGVEIGCNETCDDVRYHPALIRMYLADPKWCALIESQFIEFLKSEAKSYQFKPMKKAPRRFVHLYAEHCNLKSESTDWGTNRSVRVVGNLDSCIPRVKLCRGAQYPRRSAKLMPEPIVEPQKQATQPVEAVNLDGWTVINNGPAPQVQTSTSRTLEPQFYSILRQL